MTLGQESVSVIIVTYNSADCIIQCLDSVRSSSAVKEIFVVDNASTDDTRKVLDCYSMECKILKTIYNDMNMGLAWANNQPMMNCVGKYVLILNPDTMLKDGAIFKMVEYLEKNPGVGAVGPKNYFVDGSPHVTYHSSWSLFSPLLWRYLPYSLVRYLYDNVFGRYKERDVLFVSGACLLLHHALYVKIGGYDEAYFLAVEDAVDLCRRVKSLGYRVVFYPEAEVIHLGGKSGGQVKSLALYKGCQGNIYYQKKFNGVVPANILHFFLVLNLLIKVVLVAPLRIIFPVRYRSFSDAYMYAVKMLMTEQIPPVKSVATK